MIDRADGTSEQMIYQDTRTDDRVVGTPELMKEQN